MYLLIDMSVSRVRRIPEVTATSGAALVHFFSDDAYNMSGFNITYRLNACPSVVSTLDNFILNTVTFFILVLYCY